jgi:hypothetical protein
MDSEDFESEELLISESVGLTFHGLDLVVRAFEGQGQRLLTLCSGKDLEQVVIVPTASAAFHGHAVFVGMLL